MESSVQFEVDEHQLVMEKWVHSKKTHRLGKGQRLVTGDSVTWPPQRRTAEDKMWRDFIRLPTILFNKSVKGSETSLNPPFQNASHQPVNHLVALRGPQPFTPASPFSISPMIFSVRGFAPYSSPRGSRCPLPSCSALNSHHTYDSHPLLWLVSPLASADTRPSPRWRGWQLKRS